MDWEKLKKCRVGYLKKSTPRQDIFLVEQPLVVLFALPSILGDAMVSTYSTESRPLQYTKVCRQLVP